MFLEILLANVLKVPEFLWRHFKRSIWKMVSIERHNGLQFCSQKNQKLDRTYSEFSVESIRPPVKSWWYGDIKAVGTFYFVTNAVMILNYSALLILY